MINPLLPSLCINFVWLQQVFPTYSTHWIVAYSVDNAIQPLNNWGMIGNDRSITGETYKVIAVIIMETR